MSAENRPHRRILVITYGPLSGVRDSLIAALRRHGCEVIEAPNTLRGLRLRYLYVALICINALFVYGARYRRYLDRTWAAQWARGRANQALVDRHQNISAVISLMPIPNHTVRRRGISYAIYIDHVNLLSKRAPDFGVRFPEQDVAASWNRYERRALCDQDHVFTPSKYVERSLIEDYSVPPEKISVVGGGPNLNVDCERDRIVKDFDNHRILFVGLDPVRKGLPQLLEAFEKVIGRVPDAHLDVVGIEGKNARNVSYHGQLHGDALRKLFYQSQIFVMPTLREPFGVVFLEAMWAKTVCIGTRIGAIPEIIEDGVTGFLVEPNNIVELADRMIELLSDRERWRRMSDAAYGAAKTKWTWNLSAKQILESLFPHDNAHSGAANGERSYLDRTVAGRRLSTNGVGQNGTKSDQ